MIYCLVLVGGLCFQGGQISTTATSGGGIFVATVTAPNYVVYASATTHILQSFDFRKEPKACVEGFCIRYHKFCEPKAYKLQCSYVVMWPGIFPAGEFTLTADNHLALENAEREISIVVDREMNPRKLPLTALTETAGSSALTACPAELSFTDCIPH